MTCNIEFYLSHLQHSTKVYKTDPVPLDWTLHNYVCLCINFYLWLYILYLSEHTHIASNIIFYSSKKTTRSVCVQKHIYVIGSSSFSFCILSVLLTQLPFPVTCLTSCQYLAPFVDKKMFTEERFYLTAYLYAGKNSLCILTAHKSLRVTSTWQRSNPKCSHAPPPVYS